VSHPDTRLEEELRLPEAPFVFVTVGTDHHPFDRLVSWVDDWSARTGVACFVQTGTSQLVAQAPGADYLPYATMVDAMSEAAAVVCHGGPATIMLARQCGRVPIVMPRDPGRGEHVDGHQISFTRWLADKGQIVVTSDLAELEDQLALALSDGTSLRIDDDGDETAASVELFSKLVNGLLESRGR
jgi:UDP-N-acetylglucosamine transferase subunit ALG13